jgi:GT2 family glycosyltransferase
MLLDHDTELTEEYFLALNSELDEEIAAFVPICVSGKKQISPFFYNAKIGNYFFSKPAKHCVTTNCISAFNTCAVLSVPALEKIGGFPQMFELDFIDNYIFYKLHSLGYKIKILNTKLQHNLSLLDYKTLKISRYEKIIDAECVFAKILGKKAKFALSLWLLLRLFKQIILPEKRRFAKITLKRIFR